jgi:hypothetical protein
MFSNTESTLGQLSTQEPLLGYIISLVLEISEESADTAFAPVQAVVVAGPDLYQRIHERGWVRFVVNQVPIFFVPGDPKVTGQDFDLMIQCHNRYGYGFNMRHGPEGLVTTFTTFTGVTDAEEAAVLGQILRTVLPQVQEMSDYSDTQAQARDFFRANLKQL